MTYCIHDLTCHILAGQNKRLVSVFILTTASEAYLTVDGKIILKIQNTNKIIFQLS